MTKTWIAAVLLLGLGACQDSKETGPEEAPTATVPTVAPPVPPVTADPAAAKPLESFEGMDVNGDGFVSSAEHARATQTMFQMMDGDRDGSVTVAEMDAAAKAISGSTSLSSEKKIDTLDADSDGKLTLAEYVAGSNAMFARMDVNKDDRLDRGEWDKGYPAQKPLVNTGG